MEGKNISITQERIDLSNSIGFQWAVRLGGVSNDSSWMAKFEELRQYKEAHGYCLVGRDYPSLGKWVSRQQQNYNSLWTIKQRSQITLERVDLLNSIKFP